ncbi:hypothetical protein Fmac_005704 [Flemingia macrophylla]|uniref:Uncharacterized protein n=1 Tax=Flemingia macrophylla TaxID=520843 RepID=A0ABD1N8K7_9FABA
MKDKFNFKDWMERMLFDNKTIDSQHRSSWAQTTSSTNLELESYLNQNPWEMSYQEIENYLQELLYLNLEERRDNRFSHISPIDSYRNNSNNKSASENIEILRDELNEAYRTIQMKRKEDEANCKRHDKAEWAIYLCNRRMTIEEKASIGDLPSFVMNGREDDNEVMMLGETHSTQGKGLSRLAKHALMVMRGRVMPRRTQGRAKAHDTKMMEPPSMDEMTMEEEALIGDLPSFVMNGSEDDDEVMVFGEAHSTQGKGLSRLAKHALMVRRGRVMPRRSQWSLREFLERKTQQNAFNIQAAQKCGQPCIHIP